MELLRTTALNCVFVRRRGHAAVISLTYSDPSTAGDLLSHQPNCLHTAGDVLVYLAQLSEIVC